MKKFKVPVNVEFEKLVEKTKKEVYEMNTHPFRCCRYELEVDYENCRIKIIPYLLGNINRVTIEGLI
jgi:hypothetical protein